MEENFWQRQTAEKLLFPDLLWSRPENRNSAGKLLIVGGNLHGFAAAAEAYNEAVSAGIGTVRVLLPDAIKTAVGGVFSEAEFAPSTPSGSFSQKALSEVIEHAEWADAVLVAGDLGRNSETAILIEKFLEKSNIPTSLTKDGADYAIGITKLALGRPNTLLVITMAQLQKLVANSGSKTPVTFGMDLLRLVETLHDFTLSHSVALVVKHLNQIICAVNGQVSTTSLTADTETWRVKTAAYDSVWWLQNPTKPFEAITTAIHTMKP